MPEDPWQEQTLAQDEPGSEYFAYGNMLVKYFAAGNRYYAADDLIGAPLGVFRFDEGPGWVFIGNGGLIMDQLRTLADFQDDLNSFRDGEEREEVVS